MAHLVQPEASPFTTARQTRSAASAELVVERFLLAFGMAKDDWTEFAGASVVATQDLLAGSHGLGEQVIDGTGHGIFLPSIIEDEMAALIGKFGTVR